MVRENFLNLLMEFKKLKGFELAIFTTYSFDHIFFENVLMREIRQNNPGILIIVLVDSQHYPKSFEFTESTGVEYLLLPIPNMLFHPKVFLFLSDKKGLAYIGSHNLTLSGITHNLELTFRTEDRSLIHDIINFFMLLFAQIFEEGSPLIETLKKFESRWKISPEKKTKNRLIHNLDGPILKKAIDLLMKEFHQVSKVLVFAPFYSNERKLLKYIHTKLKAKNIDVCIQRNNHDLDVDSICDLSFVSLKEVISKEKRRIHSKFLLFFGEKSFALIGSPNFTEPALNQEAGKGNCELALLVQLEREQNIFQEFSFKDITTSDIQATLRRKLTPAFEIKKEYDVRILMASVGTFGELVLIVDAEPESKELNLIVEQPSRRAEIPIFVKRNMKRLEVQITLEVPATIWFEDNKKIVSNIIRVYNPSYPSQLNIVRYEVDSHKIPSLVASVKGLEDLLRIIAALFPEERYAKIRSKSGGVEPSPGRVRRTETSESLFEILLKVLRVPRIREGVGKRRGRETRPERSVQERIRQEQSRINYQIEVTKILDRWMATFGARRLSVDNSIINYSAFLLISIKLIEILVSDDKERIKLLSRVMNSLSALLDTYGISVKKKESLLLFISIIVYIKSEIIGAEKRPIIDYKIDSRIVRDIIQKAETLLFTKKDLLKGVKFKDKVHQTLTRVKITPRDENNVRKIIASLVAAIILTKDQQDQLNISKRMIKEIAKAADDPQALYLSFIAQELVMHNTILKSAIKLEIKNKMKDERLRYFRRILYEDIARIIEQ